MAGGAVAPPRVPQSAFPGRLLLPTRPSRSFRAACPRALAVAPRALNTPATVPSARRRSRTSGSDSSSRYPLGSRKGVPPLIPDYIRDSRGTEAPLPPPAGGKPQVAPVRCCRRPLSTVETPALAYLSTPRCDRAQAQVRKAASDGPPGPLSGRGRRPPTPGGGSGAPRAHLYAPRWMSAKCGSRKLSGAWV